ncbi:formamidopyrimidine-DNA glycosylase-like isoform X1 [Carex littledalei]|uniref:Formamidopyrimidine-DNA glycosylase-like isoform X1 n=1 Tax=Carex littledalei TaxID=544730 RepID=A0A833QTU4_9POAL|nr:formamidopyrimidine-DNA glycosylase-like isoform X1 [Carex littledalei]
MPELPEVEAARRALQAICVGRRIRRCSVARDSVVISGVSPLRLESALSGRSILEARRKGKNLWLRLDEPPFPSFQFGMAGAIYIKGVPVTNYKRSAVQPTDEWPSKYSKLFVELDDGIEFSFTDKRRFARIRLLDDPESMPPISELGPDALFEPIQLNNFIDSLSQKKTGIKALLLDQCFISGIGNWIADEVLYQARIHPLQTAANLSKESCKLLHQSINEVIKHAVEVDADSSRFPSDWLFHVRWGKKPGDVNGEKIEFITAGGRTTAYVPELQKLMGTELNRNSTLKPKRAIRDRTKSDNSAAETKKNKSKDIRKGENLANVAKKQDKRKTKIVQNGDFNGDLINDPSKKRGAVERITRQRKRPTK